jgi:chemotaxis protein CheX
MDIELISPFAEAAVSVLQSLTGSKPSVGVLGARPKTWTTQQINVVCQINGDVEGLVIYAMSAQTADRIASIITQTQIITFDKAAAATIVSLSNMMNMSASTVLSAKVPSVRFSPPTIIRGANENATLLDLPALVIPLILEGIGSIEVNVSLKRNTLAQAA